MATTDNTQEINAGIQQVESDTDNWDIVIGPRRGLLDVRLHELWHYRDLFWMFLVRDVVTQYNQTVLGPIWFILNPLMTTVMYVFVFGNIAGISTDGLPKPLFYLSGVVIWGYFQTCFTATSKTFSANAGLFGKVYFPRLIVPISKVTSNLVKFLIQLLLFIGVLVYFWGNGAPVHPTLWILATPFLVMLMGMLGLGAGIVISSFSTKYRDLNQFISFGTQLLMYGTPIVYPLSKVPEQYRVYIQLNPIAHIIEAFKFAFLGVGTVSLVGLAYTTCVACFLLFCGTIVFNRAEQNFMDTV